MAAEVLLQAADVLDSLNVDWWVSAGTLLGIYREGDFIAGDTDIDVEMTGSVGPVLRAFDRLAPRYRNGWWKETGRKIQAIWRFPKNTLFDLYIYYPDKRGLVSYTPYSDQEIIYPPDLKRTAIMFHGRRFPCWEPERYLTYVYGKDWRIPSATKSVYGNC